jgi:hypothetical protein
MSAYVVEDKTINRIVSFLQHDRDNDYIKHRLAKECGVFTWTTPEDFGRMLFALNVRSVKERYPNDHDTYPPYQYQYEVCDRMQALKSLRCWLYQSCEGEVDQEPLYQIMDDYANRLALDLVSAMPQWDAAEWG